MDMALQREIEEYHFGLARYCWKKRADADTMDPFRRALLEALARGDLKVAALALNGGAGSSQSLMEEVCGHSAAAEAQVVSL